MEYLTIIQYGFFATLGSFFFVMSGTRSDLSSIMFHIGLNATMGMGLAMMIHSINENKMFNSGLAMIVGAFGYNTSKKMLKKYINKKIIDKK